MVTAQLGTAIGMGISTDPFHTLRHHLLAFRLDRFRDPVDTTDCRDDPDFIADPDAAIGPDIAHEGLGIFHPVAARHRMIRIFLQPGQVGLHIMGMHMFPGFDICLCVADGKTVLHNVHTLGNIGQCDLVPGWDLFKGSDRKTFQVHRCSGRNFLKRNRYIIVFMNFDKFLHFYFFILH